MDDRSPKANSLPGELFIGISFVIFNAKKNASLPSASNIKNKQSNCAWLNPEFRAFLIKAGFVCLIYADHWSVAFYQVSCLHFDHCDDLFLLNRIICRTSH
jgi:hypothetical protein